MPFELLRKIRQFISISRIFDIARRYFVVNSFDGALTMLGLLLGFQISKGADLPVIITACLGAAVALAMSGLTSAYLSETAERKREFRKLQDAMVTDLSGSAQHKVSRWVPIWVALINGLSPLFISLIIITPLWLAQWGMQLPFGPIETAIGIAFASIFLLGIFLGQVSGTFWFYSGLQALVIALVTMFLIYLVT
jgi:predicted membrane protein (TIGR00267 family)